MVLRIQSGACKSPIGAFFDHLDTNRYRCKNFLFFFMSRFLPSQLELLDVNKLEKIMSTKPNLTAEVMPKTGVT